MGSIKKWIKGRWSNGVDVSTWHEPCASSLWTNTQLQFSDRSHICFTGYHGKKWLHFAVGRAKRKSLTTGYKGLVMLVSQLWSLKSKKYLDTSIKSLIGIKFVHKFLQANTHVIHGPNSWEPGWKASWRYTLTLEALVPKLRPCRYSKRRWAKRTAEGKQEGENRNETRPTHRRQKSKPNDILKIFSALSRTHDFKKLSAFSVYSQVGPSK